MTAGLDMLNVEMVTVCRAEVPIGVAGADADAAATGLPVQAFENLVQDLSQGAELSQASVAAAPAAEPDVALSPGRAATDTKPPAAQAQSAAGASALRARGAAADATAAPLSDADVLTDWPCGCQQPGVLEDTQACARATRTTGTPGSPSDSTADADRIRSMRERSLLWAEVNVAGPAMPVAALGDSQAMAADAARRQDDRPAADETNGTPDGDGTLERAPLASAAILIRAALGDRCDVEGGPADVSGPVEHADAADGPVASEDQPRADEAVGPDLPAARAARTADAVVMQAPGGRRAQDGNERLAADGAKDRPPAGATIAASRATPGDERVEARQVLSQALAGFEAAGDGSSPSGQPGAEQGLAEPGNGSRPGARDVAIPKGAPPADPGQWARVDRDPGIELQPEGLICATQAIRSYAQLASDTAQTPHDPAGERPPRPLAPEPTSTSLPVAQDSVFGDRVSGRASVEHLQTSSDPQSQPPVPTRVAAQIVRAVSLTWRQGIGEAWLRLEPASLGTVTVALRVQDGVVTATLAADRPAVREWLQMHETELRAALAEQGLDLDRLVVTADPDERRRQPPDGNEAGPRPRRRETEAASFHIQV